MISLKKLSFWTIPVALFALTALVVFGITKFATPLTQAYSSTDFKSAAEKYLQNSEKAGTPITLRYGGDYYYYVPVEINDTITKTFPGIMLNAETEAVTDGEVLKELYRYPALITQFASNVKSFDKLAVTKTAALAKYCKILNVQKIKFDEVNKQGNVVGVIYYGIKLAGDAVGMVKTSAAGLVALAKDLAKGAVKDSMVSYLTGADSRAILGNTQKAYDASVKADSSCTSALSAWNAVVSTSGRASPEYSLSAIQEVAGMYANEKTAMSELGLALTRINNYPKLVTKINKNHFKSGVSNLSKLIKQLDDEGKSWGQILTDANDEYSLGLWVSEQLDRVESATPEPEPEAVVPSSPVCSSVDLSEDYKLYTYAPDNNPCRVHKNDVSSNEVSLSCTTGSQFRNHWVKKINVAGKNSIKITADLGIGDRGFFYSMCPNGGVKYDNYSDLVVLSSDPQPTFDAECNKICTQADWPKCGITPENPAILGKCGVAKCSTSQACNLEINTAGLDNIYLVFHTSNPWPAYVTGTMSNMEVCQ